MKKGILPVIIITILVGAFILFYAVGILSGLIQTNIPVIFLILAIMVFIALICALIYTSIERIKEIEEEDEDDISKY